MIDAFGLIREHLIEFGLEFFDDDSYWDWGGALLQSNVPYKEFEQLEEYREKAYGDNSTYGDKKRFYDFIATRDVFVKVIHSMKSDEIASSCLSVINEIKDDSNILDLGCNVGYSTSFYSKYFKKSQIVGFDISKKSILRANQLNPKNPNLQFFNSFEKIKDFRFDFVIDTQCLSDIDDPQIRSNTVNDMHKVLADDGILVSVSTLKNKDEAEHFIQTLNNEGFYLQKLLPVIFKSLDKWQGYTKLVFTKIDNEMIYNVSDFFEEMLISLDQKNHS